MDLKLLGKTAFISGSTAGIGFAIAKWLLAEGVEVIINGRSVKRIDEAIDKLKEINPEYQVRGITADFQNEAEINALIANLKDVDILINNVGIFNSQSFFETPDEDWHKHFEVNVMSGVRLSRHCLPSMLEKNWGRIIFISSECAGLVPEDMIAYSMTKTAMLAVSRGLSHLTKSTGVTINTVVPGSTLSEGAERFLEGVAERENKSTKEVEENFFKEVRTTSLLQRFASVDEVASTVCYLASPLASATNGATIKVEGGSTGISI